MVDVLNRIVVDVDMGSSGIPEGVRKLFADMYADQHFFVVTQWGLSGLPKVP